MRQNLIRICAAVLAVSLPAVAKAEVIIFAPTSLATAQGTGSTGYGVGIRNGVQDPYYGTTGAVAGNTLENSASGASGGASSNASANLGDGTLHASGASVAGTTSFAFAELADTLYFNNTSGGVVGLNVHFALDGSITTAADNYFPGGYGSLTLLGSGIQVGAFGAPVTQAGNVQYLVFGKDGVHAAESTTNSGPPEGGSYAYDTTFDAGYMTGFLQTTLYLPTGLSTLGVRTQLYLDCRLGAVCDFSNTAGLTFGPLAEGLSYTSASGGFMSDLQTPPVTGVPEPATWAMMIFGFGLAGGMLRTMRRRRAQFA